MNKHIKFIASSLFAGIFLFLTFSVSANALTGKIIDVFGDKITVEMEGTGLFQAGEKIELNYMAGVMEMMIGSYEVVQVQKNVFIAKEISLVMAPSKEMNVTVIKAQGFGFDGPDPGAMEPPSRDPRFNNVAPQDYEIKYNDQEAVPDVKIQGEVVEVTGKDVRIQLTSSGDAQVGFAADLTYVTSAGLELPVGIWKVVSVNGREVTATTSDKSVEPREGMKALVYTVKEKVNVMEGLPSVEPVEEESLFNDRISSDTTAPLVPRAYPPEKEENLTLQQEIARGVERAGEEVAFKKFKKALVRRQGNSERMAARKLYSVGTSGRYWLGVEIAKNAHVIGQAFAAGPMGVRVLAVFSKSPAKKAGIEIADIIYEANGIIVTETGQFIDILNGSPNGKLKIKMQRNGKIIEKTVKLKKMRR